MYSSAICFILLNIPPERESAYARGCSSFIFTAVQCCMAPMFQSLCILLLLSVWHVSEALLL